MAKWGISKRGKRYYNWRDGDGKFTDDGVANLSDVANDMLGKSLKANSGWRQTKAGNLSSGNGRLPSSKIDSFDKAVGIKPKATRKQNKLGSDVPYPAKKPETVGAETPAERMRRITRANAAHYQDIERGRGKDTSGSIEAPTSKPQEKRQGKFSSVGRGKTDNFPLPLKEREDSDLGGIAGAERDRIQQRIGNYKDRYNQAKAKQNSRQMDRIMEEFREEFPREAEQFERPKMHNGLNNEGLDRLLVSDAKNDQKFRERVGKMSPAEVREAAERLDSYMDNLPERMDETKLMIAREKLAKESNRRDAYGLTAGERSEQGDNSVRPKRTPEQQKLADEKLRLTQQGFLPPGGDLDRARAAEQRAKDADWLDWSASKGVDRERRAEAFVKKYGESPFDTPKNEQSDEEQDRESYNDQVVLQAIEEGNFNGLSREAMVNKLVQDDNALYLPKDQVEAALSRLEMDGKLDSKPPVVEGKDARSMTAAEKLEAGRQMFGDRGVAKKAGAAELNAAAVDNARKSLLRATRSMNPQQRQEFYNEAATNGSTPEVMTAAIQMGGRPDENLAKNRGPSQQEVNAQNVAPADVAAARQRVANLEAIENPTPEQRRAQTQARNELAKLASRVRHDPNSRDSALAKVDVLTGGGNMDPSSMENAVRRALMNKPSEVERQVLNEKLKELKDARQRRQNVNRGLNPDGSPIIPDVVGALTDGETAQSKAAERAREEGRMDPYDTSEEERRDFAGVDALQWADVSAWNNMVGRDRANFAEGYKKQYGETPDETRRRVDQGEGPIQKPATSSAEKARARTPDLTLNDQARKRRENDARISKGLDELGKRLKENQRKAGVSDAQMEEIDYIQTNTYGSQRINADKRYEERHGETREQTLDRIAKGQSKLEADRPNKPLEGTTPRVSDEQLDALRRDIEIHQMIVDDPEADRQDKARARRIIKESKESLAANEKQNSRKPVQIGNTESRLAEARQEVDSLQYLLSDSGLDREDRRDITKSLAQAKRDLKTLEKQDAAEKRAAHRESVRSDAPPTAAERAESARNDPARRRENGLARDIESTKRDIARIEQQLKSTNSSTNRNQLEVQLLRSRRGLQSLQNELANERETRTSKPRVVNDEPQTKVGVKSRPVVPYTAGYEALSPERKKSYRAKRRKLIDAAVEAGLPNSEIQRLFTQNEDMWPTAAELKRLRRM